MKLKLAEENPGTRFQDTSIYKYSLKRTPRIDNQIVWNFKKSVHQKRSLMKLRDNLQNGRKSIAR